MVIQLTKDLRFSSDELNFILERKKVAKKKGTKESWKTVGYYPTLEMLVDNLVELEIKRFDASTLQDIANSVKELKTSLINAYTPNFNVK